MYEPAIQRPAPPGHSTGSKKNCPARILHFGAAIALSTTIVPTIRTAAKITPAISADNLKALPQIIILSSHLFQLKSPRTPSIILYLIVAIHFRERRGVCAENLAAATP
jgi:hypothetical protein